MTEIRITVPPELVEEIAERAAAIVLERLEPAPVSPYMTIPEAAEFLRAKSRQRVDDLLSQRRLTRFKDGDRTLVSRAELEAYVAGGNGSARCPDVAHVAAKPHSERDRETSDELRVSGSGDSRRG